MTGRLGQGGTTGTFVHTPDSRFPSDSQCQTRGIRRAGIRGMTTEDKMSATITTTAYDVSNHASGHRLGVWGAESPEEAIAAMMRQARDDGPADPDVKATPLYTATLEGGKVSIYDANGVWAGTGTWDGQSIQDCDAVLGDVEWDGTDAQQREAEAIYDALDEGLRRGTE